MLLVLYLTTSLMSNASVVRAAVLATWDICSEKNEYMSGCEPVKFVFTGGRTTHHLRGDQVSLHVLIVRPQLECRQLVALQD